MIEFYSDERYAFSTGGAYLQWLASLQPGDRWRCVHHHRYSNWHDILDLEVGKLTNTQIVLTNGARYKRDTGRKVGGTAFNFLMPPSTEAAIQAVLVERRRMTMARDLEAVDWRKLPIDKLEVVTELLKETEDDTERQS